MAVSMTYGGYSFDPVPLVQLSIEHVRNQMGELINVRHVATLQGTLLSSNTPTPGIVELVDQIDEMRAHLSDCSGCKRFRVVCDGAVLIDAYAIVNGLDFQQSPDNWVLTANYTAELEWNAISDLILMASTGVSLGCLECLTTTEESWEIGQVESPAQYTASGTCPTGVPQILNITHNLSAAGYNCCISGGVQTEGWEAAREWVEGRLGFDQAILGDISGSTMRLLPSAFVAYNHTRQVNINKTLGEYGVTESWLVIGDSGAMPYLEDYTVETTTDLSSRFTSISVNGSIQGLETRNFIHQIQASKWDNALVGWMAVEPQLYSRASCLGGIVGICPINTTPSSRSVTKNPKTGIINYAYNYNTRHQLISGSLTEQINVSNVRTSSQIIEVPIIGRRSPLLYDIQKNTTMERSVSISVLMSQPTGCFYEGNSLCNRFMALYNLPPTGNVKTLLCCIEQDLDNISSNYWKISDTDDWDPINGQYSKQVSYQYEIPCVSGVAPPSYCS